MPKPDPRPSDASRRLLYVVGALVAGAIGGAVTIWASLPREPAPTLVRAIVRAPGLDATELDEQIALPLAAALEPDETELVARDGRVEARVLTTRGPEGVLQRMRDTIARLSLGESVHASLEHVPDAPALRWALVGDDAHARAEALLRSIEPMDGVLRAELCGAPERELVVAVDVGRARAHGLTVADIADALGRASTGEPARRVEGEVVIGGAGRSGLEDVVVRGDLRVSDVAVVREERADMGCACVASPRACAIGTAYVRADAVPSVRAHLASEGATFLDRPGAAVTTPTRAPADLRRLTHDLAARVPDALFEIGPALGVGEPRADLRVHGGDVHPLEALPGSRSAARASTSARPTSRRTTWSSSSGRRPR